MIEEIIGTDAFFSFIVSSEVVVVDFHAPWCKPCVNMLRILPNLATDLDGLARMGKVNIDENSELKTIYDITGIPAFVFFKTGRKMYHHTGVMTLAEIKAKVMELQ